MHKVSEEIENNITIPFLHIVDATAEIINQKSLKKVGLIATQFSMEGDFLRNRYKENFGLETIIPNEQDRIVIHNIIYNELVKGIINENSKKRFLKIIDKLVENGAQGIISGCTEIELLITPNDIKVDLFETTKIHANAAVKFALQE